MKKSVLSLITVLTLCFFIIFTITACNEEAPDNFESDTDGDISGGVDNNNDDNNENDGNGSNEPTEEEKPAPVIYKIKIYDENGKWLLNVETEDGGAYDLSEVQKPGYIIDSFADSSSEEFPVTGTITADCSITANFTLAETKTFEELKSRAEAGVDRIYITDDIIITDTVFVVGNTTIYTDADHVLTRSSDFLGDIFVVGEKPDGQSVVETSGVAASLTLKTENGSSLVIDGNKENITETVKGTAVLVVHSSTVYLEENVTLKNLKKTGNEKVLNSAYAVSKAYRAGGAAVMVINGTLNINGASFIDNEVNSEDAVDDNTEIGVSSCGGAVHSYGTVNINGAVFSGNSAARGGALYNYASLHIENAVIENNTASVYGGAIYLPNTQYCEMKLGTEEAGEDYAVTFKSNSSTLSGGAIFAQVKTSIVIYGSTLFESNKSKTSNGGAISSSSALIIKSADFKNNEAASKGGAVYIYCANEDLTVRMMSMDSGLFESNRASKGGAFACSASSTEFTKGAVGYIGDVTFKNNVAFMTDSEDYELPDSAEEDVTGEKKYNGKGGAIYIARKGAVEVNGAIFEDNSAEENGGAVYVTGESRFTVNNTEFINNISGYRGGAIYATTNTVATVTDCVFSGNSAQRNGGAISAHVDTVVNISDSEFSGNKSLVSHGGAISIYSGSTVNAEASSFTENKAVNAIDETTTEGKGGAIHVQGDTDNSINSNLNLDGVSFASNEAGEHGGAINLYSGAVIVVKNSSFTGNKATASGGAIYSSGSVSNIENSEFISNNAGENGGAVALYTGSICDIKNKVVFTENTAAELGGAVYSNGKATVLNITDSELKLNSVANDKGGALYVTGAVVTVDSVIFTENSAAKYGGVISAHSSANITFKKSVFTKNTAVTGGGAISIFSKATVSVTDCEFTENSAKNGGAVYITGETSKATVYASAFDGNSAESGGAIFVTEKGAADVTDSEFNKNKTTEGNGGAVYVYTDAVFTGDRLTFTENTSSNYGGGFYLSGASKTDLSGISAIGNTAGTGGFIYITTTGTELYLRSKAEANDDIEPISGNTASKGGNLIWSNSSGTTIYIDFTKFPELRYNAETDADGVDNLEDGYSDNIGFKTKDKIEELASE